ncbi:hypothetical protein HDU96_001685 [Phlyctochytrium bullatum]|nr:hypothetical protein HDU96_001685 [Phlyctochytrium bullatum]
MSNTEKAIAEVTAEGETVVVDWTPEEERKVMRKIDIRIVPLCLMLYLFSFLDRVNIGNARVIGLNPRTGLGQMERDLGMRGNDFNISLSVFFITYCLFEPFSNLILNRTSASSWIARIAVTWGITATCMGAVQNFAGLVATRILLGLFEAGLVPGISYYCSFWYKREELASRIALWFGGAGLATAFSSLLAYGIQIGMEGKGGLASWRWVFIIEGAPTILLGVLTWFFLPDEPGKATFLSERERHIAASRLKLSVATREEKHFSSAAIVEVIKNPIVWVFAVSNFLAITPGYAYSFFIPTILAGGLGKTGVDINLFSAPPFLVGAVCTIVFSFMSDYFRSRSLFALLASAAATAAWTSLALVRDANQAYGLLFLSAFSGFAYPVIWAWLSNNIPSHTGRALALGLVLGIGNVGGAIAGQLYTNDDRPWFAKGHTALAIMSGINIAVLIGLRGWMQYLNATKERRLRDREAKGETISAEEQEFVYTL